METIKITGIETHKFFAVSSSSFEPIDRDAEGRIRVYCDQALCLEKAKLIAGTVTVIVVGMGDKKWAKFQREEKYVEIKST